jgi:hypothetical protein
VYWELVEALERIGEVPGWFGGNSPGTVLFGARDVFGDDEASSHQHKKGEHRDGGQDKHLFCNKDSKGSGEDGAEMRDIVPRQKCI